MFNEAKELNQNQCFFEEHSEFIEQDHYNL